MTRRSNELFGPLMYMLPKANQLINFRLKRRKIRGTYPLSPRMMTLRSVRRREAIGIYQGLVLRALGGQREKMLEREP